MLVLLSYPYTMIQTKTFITILYSSGFETFTNQFLCGHVAYPFVFSQLLASCIWSYVYFSLAKFLAYKKNFPCWIFILVVRSFTSSQVYNLSTVQIFPSFYCSDPVELISLPHHLPPTPQILFWSVPFVILQFDCHAMHCICGSKFFIVPLPLLGFHSHVIWPPGTADRFCLGRSEGNMDVCLCSAVSFSV